MHNMYIYVHITGLIKTDIYIYRYTCQYIRIINLDRQTDRYKYIQHSKSTNNNKQFLKKFKVMEKILENY